MNAIVILERAGSNLAPVEATATGCSVSYHTTARTMVGQRATSLSAFTEFP
mgnify:CR=1 FL=1